MTGYYSSYFHKISAATNRMCDLDPALLRRFERKILVGRLFAFKDSHGLMTENILNCAIDLPDFEARCGLILRRLESSVLNQHTVSKADIEMFAERSV